MSLLEESHFLQATVGLHVDQRRHYMASRATRIFCTFTETREDVLLDIRVGFEIEVAHL